MLMGGVGCLVCNRDVRTKDGLWFQWCYGMGGLFVCLLFSPRCVYRGWRIKVNSIFYPTEKAIFFPFSIYL